ncbi:n-acetylglutamate synthase [Plebeiibacterium sediminum]|uniref:N-acetylglutamate synthase n=1 Tax=Plebeiibacterium sediminum TaxID=2992112 RepID=A0AAE3M8S8_9BACT|nr:n-acetylglutamate synthase [Plebeiobacterium sediminum]MCW3789067.1 n-acetylglutamate synthase [Plebeiobacterium sediminum]
MINLNNKAFITQSNTEHGDTNQETIFLYKQSKSVVTAEYKGGTIKSGNLYGTIDRDGNIDMQYHHTNFNNQLLTGICRSKVERLDTGKLRIIEDWQWTSKDFSKGRSILEEIDPTNFFTS